MSEVYPAWIFRRARFICEEARLPDRVRDHAVNYSLRVLSNYVAVSTSGDSRKIKLLNPRISRKALDELLKLENKMGDRSKAFDAWHKLTTNEHPDPLTEVWDWLCEANKERNEHALLSRLSEHPMCTVLKSEDAKISQAGQRKSGSPAVRHASIHAVKLEFSLADWQTDSLLVIPQLPDTSKSEACKNNLVL